MCTKRAPLACASSIIRGQPARGRENSGEVRERRRPERIGIPSRKATTPVRIIARNSDGSAASFTHYLPAISVVIVAIRSTSDLVRSPVGGIAASSPVAMMNLRQPDRNPFRARERRRSPCSDCSPGNQSVLLAWRRPG